MVIYNCINVHLKSSQTEEDWLKEITKKKINKFKVSYLKLSLELTIPLSYTWMQMKTHKPPAPGSDLTRWKITILSCRGSFPTYCKDKIDFPIHLSLHSCWIWQGTQQNGAPRSQKGKAGHKIPLSPVGDYALWPQLHMDFKHSTFWYETALQLKEVDLHISCCLFPTFHMPPNTDIYVSIIIKLY